MADKARYPQIPSTVWWGVRSILQRTPNTVIDERLLGVQLGVQEAAARAYVGELRAVGILTEENKGTPLAQKWRLDDTYSSAAKELVAAVYPESLRNVAPPEEGDRQKIVSWFLREGLGQGAAGNKAATYLLIGSPTPNDSASRIQRSPKEGSEERPKRATEHKNARPPAKPADRTQRPLPAADSFPLNLNVQIHISADAGSEQIEAIFKAMRRYLYDASTD